MKNEERMLQIEFPELYQLAVENLQENNIHSYDVQLAVKEADTGFELILYFGEAYSHKKSEQFTRNEIESLAPSILEFIKNTAEKIKEVMVSDYFKMMKP